MRTFWTAQRQALALFWREALRAELQKAGIVALALLAAGVVSSILSPKLCERLFELFSSSFSASGILEKSGFALFWGIFTNNLSAMFTTILWGLVPFLYLTAFSLGLNFSIIGAFGVYSVRGGVSLLAYCAGIVPHGLLEIPAILLSCAAGLCLCRSITSRIRKKPALPIVDAVNGCVGLYWIVLLPLTAGAALLETFVTPWVMGFFL